MNAYDPETAVIGCAVLGDNAGDIFAGLAADDFESDLLREVFVGLSRLWAKTGSLDGARIKSLGRTDLITATMTCCETVPSLSGWEAYVKAVKDAAIKRRAEKIAGEIALGDLTAEEIGEKASALSLVVNGAEDTPVINMTDGVLGWMTDQTTKKEYLKTGFSRLDKYGYIDRGDYIVIGGRPSSGKTAFSLNLALNFAKTGKKIAYFSLETSPGKLVERMVAAWCGMDFERMKRRQLGANDYDAELLDALSQLPIMLIQASGKTVSWMRNEAVRLKADIAMIDYLGLIRGPGRDRYETVTNISLELHEMAQRTGITVFALSQLNRGGVGKAPTMEDIRESGQVEQDADLILLLYKREEGSSDPGNETVVIGKNKEGQCGDLYFWFDGQHQKFNEVNFTQ